VRTTVTLDADAEAWVRALMRERGLSFKEALNEAIRLGRGAGRVRHETPTVAMGVPTIPLDRALRIAGDLEDEELLRRLATGT
jgi:hypothetical protein